ncbi:hypothetical protein SynWH8103_01412 [Synechococcus sp. WH 8103]|nr:hypothetical protein SynWH8103_01412 [Synechococcus sp. WH 8103]
MITESSFDPERVGDSTLFLLEIKQKKSGPDGPEKRRARDSNPR